MDMGITFLLLLPSFFSSVAVVTAAYHYLYTFTVTSFAATTLFSSFGLAEQPSLSAPPTSPTCLSSPPIYTIAIGTADPTVATTIPSINEWFGFTFQPLAHRKKLDCEPEFKFIIHFFSMCQRLTLNFHPHHGFNPDVFIVEIVGAPRHWFSCSTCAANFCLSRGLLFRRHAGPF